MNKYLDRLASLETLDRKSSILLHIPHSSYIIPNEEIYDKIVMKSCVEEMTDHATEKIFKSNIVKSVIFPYSRVYCDVERFEDSQESMAKIGMGFYYTKDQWGNILRDEQEKEYIRKNIFIPYQESISQEVEKILRKNGSCLIIDCHSFPNKPFKYESHSLNKRPSICIGYDNFHTKKNLLEYTKSFFERQGFDIAVNYPFQGSYVPKKFYLKESLVQSIMIEVNRSLYMRDNLVDELKVQELNKIMQEYYDVL